MANKRARFAINVDSGVVVFRSNSTDALPTLWKLIDDATATAIVKKKVSATAVIEAIQKSIVRDEGFNWKEYDAKRRKDRELFNVSEHDMVPDGEKNPNGEGEQEKEDGEVLSLKDLGLGGAPSGRGGKPIGKPNRTNKPSGAHNGGMQGGEQKGNKPPENPNNAAGAGGVDAGSGSAGGEGAGAGAAGGGEGAGMGEGAGDGDEVQY